MPIIVTLAGALLLAASLAAAAPLPAYSPGEEVVAEINLARTDPAAYAGHLRRFLSQFQGKLYRLEGSFTYVRTAEGEEAVDEAIRFLLRQRPLPAVTWSAPLAAAAGDLAAEQGDTGATGHDGARSGGLRRRVERHARWQGELGETIYYGSDDPRLVVMQLIIDDGVPNRGHRATLFDRSFGRAGAACGGHPRYDRVCVADFAAETPDGGL